MSIYFIRAGRTVKIGYTGGDPRKRLAALQTGNHRRLDLVLAIPGELADEARLHDRFAAHRVTGEWFTYARPVRALVRSLRGWDLSEPETDPALLWEEPEPEQQDSDLLCRVRTVWPAGADRASTAELLGSLIGSYPEAYAGWQAADLTRALRFDGVEARPLKKLDPNDPRRSVRGYLLAEIEYPEPSIVGHILDVWPAGRDRATSAKLAVNLAAQWDDYAGWEAADVTRALKAVGIDAKKIRVGANTAAGVLLSDLVPECQDVAA